MMNIVPRCALVRFALVCLGAGLSSAAKAQLPPSYTYVGGGSDNNLATANNYTGGTAPGSAQVVLHLNVSGGGAVNNNFADYGPGFQLLFDNGSGSISLGGNGITFYDYGSTAPLIENDSANTQTITLGFGMATPLGMDIKAVNGDLMLGTAGGNGFFFNTNNGNAPGALRVDGGAGRTVTFNNSIFDGSGSGSLIVGTTNTPSTFTTVLKANCSYTGTTTINGGTLALSANGSLYNNGNNAGSIVVNSGATLRFDHSDVFGNSSNTSPVVITANGGTVASNGTINVLRNANFNGAILLSNGGTVGAAFGLGGTVTIGGTAATLFKVAITDNSNLMLGREGTSEVTTFNVGDVVSGSDLVVQNAMSNNFGATSGLTKAGAGTLESLGNNTYTGTTTVNAGTLIIAGTATGNGQVIINNAGVLQFGNGSSANGSSTNSGTIFVNNTGTVQVNKTDGGTVASVVASNPSATTTLSGTNAAGTTNSFTATAYSNGGNFNTNSTNAGATLAFTNAQAIDLKGTTLNVNGAGNTLFSGSVYSSTNNGVGNLIKNDAGTATISSDSSYGGTTMVNGGVLALDSAGSTTARLSATTSIAVNNGGTLRLANSGATASTDRINNSAAIILAGGTMNLGGFSEGAAGTNGVGALTLSATSALDFGPTGTSNLIQFAGLGSHAAGTQLQIMDWEGTSGSSNGADRLLFAGNASDFTAAYGQNDVSFNGAAGYGVQSFGGYYEVFGITPVPEPATVFAGAALLGLVFWRQRKGLATGVRTLVQG